MSAVTLAPWKPHTIANGTCGKPRNVPTATVSLKWMSTPNDGRLNRESLKRNFYRTILCPLIHGGQSMSREPTQVDALMAIAHSLGSISDSLDRVSDAIEHQSTVDTTDILDGFNAIAKAIEGWTP